MQIFSQGCVTMNFSKVEIEQRSVQSHANSQFRDLTEDVLIPGSFFLSKDYPARCSTSGVPFSVDVFRHGFILTNLLL